MTYDFGFGFTNNLDNNELFISDLETKFKHLYIIGKTGTGKSVLMERMANYDIKKGLSVIYIDPKGDNSKKLYKLNKDKHNVRYISFEPEHKISINPLNKKGYSHDDIIVEFSQIMDVLITRTSPNPEMTVRMKEIITYALKALFVNYRFDKNIFRILFDFLNDSNYRKVYFNKFKGNPYQEWWDTLDIQKNKGFKVWGDFNLTISSLTSRLSQFLMNDEMKNIISDKNELYIDEMLENNQSLLVNTYTASMDNKIFLSNLIVYSVYSYIHQKRNRKPLIVYIDEFQFCASELFSWMLQISRSYQVGFVLAHQNFASLSPTLLSSIFGNTNSFVVFRCGDDEAKKFAQYFDASASDLLNLSDYQAFVRIGNESVLSNTHPPIEGDSPEPESLFFLGDNWIDI